MSRWRRFVLTTVPGVVVAMGASPGLALGIGPYTLPFHDHTTTVVRGYTTDHRGIDYNLNYEPVVAARQGVVVDLREGYADSGTCTPVEGNYVLIRHPDGQHTLYLHLKQNSVIVSVNSQVSAGQKIATSGNSGYSCGPHLHYILVANANWRDAASTLNPNGDWTTADPGKVPFLASYVREHSAAGYSALTGSVWTTWVEFRNDGGRTWTPTNDSYGRGRVFLDATNSSGSSSRTSAFYVSGDWETSSRPGQFDDASVTPGETARITFKLRASAAGSYNEHFNLGALSVTYFNYPRIGYFYIPITVSHCC